VLHRLRLLIQPETVLRWHRDLIRRRHAAISHPKRTGRPPTADATRWIQPDAPDRVRALSYQASGSRTVRTTFACGNASASTLQYAAAGQSTALW
jgi:hypothetical protein